MRGIVLLSAALLSWNAAESNEAAAIAVATQNSVCATQTKHAIGAPPVAGVPEVQYHAAPKPVWHAPTTTSSGLVPLTGQTFAANRGAKLTILGGVPTSKINTTTAISGTGMSRKH